MTDEDVGGDDEDVGEDEPGEHEEPGVAQTGSSSRPDSGFGRNEPDLCEYLLGMAEQNSVILESGILFTYRNLYFKSG